MSNQELTPELIPASQEQVDELVANCSYLLSIQGWETHPDPLFYRNDYVLESCPPFEIEANLTPLAHKSDVLDFHDALFVAIGHDGAGNIAAHDAAPAVEVKFLRHTRILYNFWLPSCVQYELDTPLGDMRKSSDTTSSMLFSSERLQDGIEKSEQVDSVLHAALKALQRERDENMNRMLNDWQDHTNTVRSSLQSEQEERRLGLQEVSYSEADIVIAYLRRMSGSA